MRKGLARVARHRDGGKDADDGDDDEQLNKGETFAPPAVVHHKDTSLTKAT